MINTRFPQNQQLDFGAKKPKGWELGDLLGYNREERKKMTPKNTIEWLAYKPRKQLEAEGGDSIKFVSREELKKQAENGDKILREKPEQHHIIKKKGGDFLSGLFK